MTKSVAFGWVLSFLSASLVSCQLDTCPTEEKIKTGVKELVSQEFTVESIQPLRNIPGLCEVVIKVGAQPLVFYTDKEMKYVMAGNLISLADKKNITRERKEEFMKLNQEELKELEKHKDFAFGKVGSQKYIYLWTDPDCPFCKRSESMVEKWAIENGVEVRVILFPLPIHPQAFGKSVALVCDKKGWEEYKSGYNSGSQCKDGKKKIESNLSLAERYGISGTPTFIGMNGKIHTGVAAEKDLDRLIQ